MAESDNPQSPQNDPKPAEPELPWYKDSGYYVAGLGCGLPTLLIVVGLLWKFCKWAFL